MDTAATSTNTPTTPPAPQQQQQQPQPQDTALIKSHLEHLVATRLPRSPLYAFLLSGVRIASASRGSFAARLRLEPRHINAGGSLHGGASAAIVDWAGGMAIATWDLREATGVSVDIHVRYLASAREGDEVLIEGWAERVGGAVAFTRVEISREEGDGGKEGRGRVVVASGTHTKYVKQR